MEKEKTLENLKAVKCRSTWDKGVKEYAYMLLNDLFLNANYKEITDFKSLHEALLRGASNWKRFSYGCCALVTNEDIAKTLCSPSELKKCKNGMLRPNKNEAWLDVQTRALIQAERLIKECVEF